MILAATGHEAVDHFLETQSESVTRMRDWTQLRGCLADATHLVLSERLNGLPSWDEVNEVVEAHTTLHWLIWLPERMRNTEEVLGGAELVFGDLEAVRLTTWLEKDWSRESVRLALTKRWIVWRPGLEFNQKILSWIGDQAQHQYGSGCWVDLDWHNAQLTARWDPDAWKHTSVEYARLKARKARQGCLVVAPPPWHLFYETPEANDIQGLMRRDYAWQGLDVGADLRPPFVMRAIEAVSQAIILMEEPWIRVLEEGLKILKTVNPDLDLVGIGESDAVARVISQVGTWIPWESAGSPSHRPGFFKKWPSIRLHKS